MPRHGPLNEVMATMGETEYEKTHELFLRKDRDEYRGHMLTPSRYARLPQ
jgi:hypothetical protein